jgi:hypothetical protein
MVLQAYSGALACLAKNPAQETLVEEPLSTPRCACLPPTT